MLKGDNIALYLSGQPVPIESCNVVMTQPTIRNIVAFKESEFLLAANILGKPEQYVSKLREGNSELSEYTDFQILMVLIKQDSTLLRACESFFQLTFPNYIVKIESEICFYKDEKRVGMINPFNLQDFSQTVSNLFLMDSGKKEYNPANEKAKKLADKFEKYRQQLAAIKKTGKETATLFGSYISVLSIGMNLDINILYGYTPFQLYNTFNRYWRKVKSDFYQRVSTMPMMDTSKMEEPDDWTENLY